MKILVAMALCFVLCGCPSVYQTDQEELKRDIKILKLEVRKARLENELRDLENDTGP
jgi:hypothetical protein